MTTKGSSTTGSGTGTGGGGPGTTAADSKATASYTDLKKTLAGPDPAALPPLEPIS